MHVRSVSAFILLSFELNLFLASPLMLRSLRPKHVELFISAKVLEFLPSFLRLCYLLVTLVLLVDMWLEFVPFGSLQLFLFDLFLSVFLDLKSMTYQEVWIRSVEVLFTSKYAESIYFEFVFQLAGCQFLTSWAQTRPESLILPRFIRCFY